MARRKMRDKEPAATRGRLDEPRQTRTAASALAELVAPDDLARIEKEARERMLIEHRIRSLCNRLGQFVLAPDQADTVTADKVLLLDVLNELREWEDVAPRLHRLEEVDRRYESALDAYWSDENTRTDSRHKAFFEAMTRDLPAVSDTARMFQYLVYLISDREGRANWWFDDENPIRLNVRQVTWEMLGESDRHGSIGDEVLTPQQAYRAVSLIFRQQSPEALEQTFRRAGLRNIPAANDRRR